MMWDIISRGSLTSEIISRSSQERKIDIEKFSEKAHGNKEIII